MVKNNSVRNEQGERGNDRKGKFKRVFFEHIRGAKKYSSLTPYINSPLCRYSFPFLTSPVLFFNLCLPLPFVTATYDLWSSEDYYRFKMRVEVGATVKDYVECVVSALKVHISKLRSRCCISRLNAVHASTASLSAFCNILNLFSFSHWLSL